jgi:hypothetical protein
MRLTASDETWHLAAGGISGDPPQRQQAVAVPKESRRSPSLFGTTVDFVKQAKTVTGNHVNVKD